MSRRKQAQSEAVAERTQQILAGKAQRRKRRRGDAEAQAPEQPESKRTSRPQPERKERKPRVHADLLTVAFRGPLAGKFREMAERYQMALSTLLKDALLSYESNVTAGYQPGSSLAEWKAQQAQTASST